MSDPTEPAIPVLAAVPMQSIKDLMRLAEHDFGGLDRPGVRVTFDITEAHGARVVALVKVYQVVGGAVAERSFDGQWRGGVFVQWTPRQA